MTFRTNRFRLLAWTSLVPKALPLTMALFAGSARSEAPKSAPVTGDIHFSLRVGAGPGHVICALFRREGWLKTPIQSRKSDIRASGAECVFTGVSPGVYAASAFHDENDNGKLDTGLFGIPTESWCTSRDAKGMFGPPSFDDAQFRYLGGIALEKAQLK